MIRPHAERQPLVIYGAGGHGRVVAEAAEAAGWLVLGFLDDVHGSAPDLNWPLLPHDDPRLTEAAHHVAIGDNEARRRITADLRHAGRALGTVIHPAAWVSPSATVGEGVLVGPGAVVHTDAAVRDGAIVNSRAVVEHDCELGPFCHLAPGATTGGGVRIGGGALVGLNTAVLPRVRVGEWCTLGAGAVVVRDVADGEQVVGVPARKRP